MKAFNIILTCSILASLTSCVSTNFIQVYKTETDKKLVYKDSLYVYEDDNCIVSYNLWEEGGNIGFKIYNKTDKNIYLNLKECFFVINGIANDYYKNRVVSYSGGVGTASSFSNYYTIGATGIDKNSLSKSLSFGYSVSISQNEQIIIPPKSAKLLSEYNINNDLIRTCDLLKYPKKRDIKTASFSKEQSPLVFGNRLAYCLEGSANPIRSNHDFYVSEITNYPEKVAYERSSIEFCGQKSTETIQRIKYTSSDKFYIKYKRGGDFFKH
jgi:hypothetical protein